MSASRRHAQLDGSDAMNQDAGLLGGLRRPAHRRRRPGRATASPSRSGAATTRARGRAAVGRRAGRARRRRAAGRPGRLLRGIVSDSSCAGSARRRASSTSAIGAVVNAALGSHRPSAPVTAVAAAGRHDAGGAGRPASTSATSPTRSPRDEALAILRRSAPGRAERIGRAARAAATRPTPPSPAGSATPTTSCARLLPRGRRRRASTTIKLKVGGDLDDDIRRLRHRPRGDRPGRHRSDRRQPVLGRGGRDRLGASAARRSTRLDRGADQPRRHARPRRDPPGGRRRRGGHRRARAQPGDVQAAVAGRRDRRLPARRLPGWAA